MIIIHIKPYRTILKLPLNFRWWGVKQASSFGFPGLVNWWLRQFLTKDWDSLELLEKQWLLENVPVEANDLPPFFSPPHFEYFE